MISRRNGRFRAPVLAVAAALFAACSTSELTQPGIHGEGATRDGGPGCVGSSGGACAMSARVLIDKAGRAVLEIRPGSFDNATNTGQPDGYIENVQYKIIGNDGKQISVTSVNVSATQLFTAVLPPSFSVLNTVDLQVNIKDQSGKKGTSVVRGGAVTLYNPNINLVAAGIDVHRPSPSNTVLPLGGPTIVAVQTGVPSHYTVDFTNDYVNSAPPAVGIQMTCVVLVDGVVVTTGITFTNGPSLFVGPGLTNTCAFDLTLTALGTHTITVRGVAVYPNDYDPSDNTVSGPVTVIPDKPLDSGGASPGVVKEEIWYVGPNASGPVYGLTKQDASITRLSTLIVNADGDLGDFALTATMSSGGTLFETVALNFEHLFANSCQTQRIVNAGYVNNAVVEVEICAIPSAANGSPAQAITITYSSAINAILWSDPSVAHALFGDTVDLNFHISRSVGGVVVDGLGAPVSITVAPPVPNPVPPERVLPPDWGIRPGVVRINAGA